MNSMTILKQNNKIIRNLAGEILTEALDLDISTSYGTTLNGSSIERIINKSKSFKFNANTGQEPLDNGNGIEFTGVAYQHLRGVSSAMNYEGDFWLGFWIKPNVNITTYGEPVFLKRDDGTPFSIFLNSNSVGSVPMSFKNTGGDGISRQIGSSTNAKLIRENWTYILYAKQGTRHAFFYDGKFGNYGDNLAVGFPDSMNQSLDIGTYYNNANYPPYYSIEDIKSQGSTFNVDFTSFNSANYDVWYFTPPKRSSE